MTALEFVQFVAACSENPAHDAAWVSTPTDGPRYSCRECGEPPPAPTEQVRRWVDSDGRALL